MKIRYFWKPLICFILITVLSLMPVRDLPKPDFMIPHFDKLMHAGMYFILCIFSIAPFAKTGFRSSYLLAFLSSVTIGALFEILQSALNVNRSGSIYDFLANTAGAILALFAYRYLVLGSKLEPVFKVQ